MLRGRDFRAAERGSPIEYLIVLPVPFHRAADTVVATESAFCEHLRMLRRMLSPTFTGITVASPSMPRARFDRDREHLGRIDEQREGIRWVELHRAGGSRLSFWTREFVPVFRRLWREVRRADVVHSGTSHNLFRPIELAALALAKLMRKKTICVVDMDLREEARMNYATGRWNRANLLINRGLYDPLRNLQLELASSHCSLVLLKGRRMHRDFGRGREHVKYFLDSAYSTEHLIPAEAFASKVQDLRERGTPLRVVYFGRLTASKGIDRCIEAVARARRMTTAPLHFTIIGAGEEEAALRRLAAQLCVDDAVTFRGALPFGPELFRALYPMHLLVAAPMIEDTPRSALDALACGIPILAFDTEYYSDLEASGAVDTVRWPSSESMARRLVHYAQHPDELVPLAERALEFARTNTQEEWLGSRVRWTLAAVGVKNGPQAEAMSWRRVEST